MLRNNSIAVKFFLGFFLTSAIAILLMMLIVYFTVKSNVINTRIDRLEIIHNIKAKQLQHSISNMENPLLRFLKNNYSSYGLDKIINAYNKLPEGIDDNTIALCRQEIAKHYAGEFNNKPVLDILNISSNDAVPVSDSGIIAQCLDFMDKIGMDSFEGINNNIPSIKEYKKLAKYFSNTFSLLLDTQGFENILFVSSDDDIVYATRKSSVLGHNLVSSYWIKGLSNQISKFHSMAHEGGSEYYFIDMHPYMALDGYPVFFIISPIFKDSKYFGSIILVLSAKFLDNILSDSNSWEEEGLGKTGDAYITSLNGIFRSNKRDLVERPNDYLALLKNKKNPAIMYDMVEYFGTVAYYSSILRNPPLDAYEGKSGYEFSKTIDGIDIVTYYSPLSIGNLKWILFVRMELSEIVSEVAPIKILMRNMIIPVLIILLTVTAAFAYFITKPIRQMQKNCMAIAMGETSSIDVQGSYKEINDLVKSFDTMITTLIENEKQTDEVKKALEDSLLNQAVIAQELKEEKDFITRILDAKGFIIFVIDENDKIIRTNNAIQKFFADKELIGLNYEEIIPDEYRRRVVSIVSLLRGGDNQIPHLITEVVIDDKRNFIEWNFSVFISRDFEDGHPMQYITAIGVNVTERYEAEQSSKENAAMFHRIFSNAYDAILIADENNNILLVNKSFESLFDVDYVDLVGKPVITNIISNEYKNVILSDTQEGKSLEIEALRSDKSKFPVDISISKIMYQGKLSILYILRDASLRKKKERELQAALKRARDAERTKSEFLANMSHEIRTPLNGIMGFIDLLKETKLDNTQKEYLKIINSSSDGLFSIINDILDFSKIESGKMQLESIEFNSWNVFEDSAAIYAAKAMDKNILLICLFSIDMPKYLLGDPLRIRQIITNLISNAIKFTDIKGRVILRVTLISKNDEKCKIRISIKDNGIGITKEQQQKIMDAFSQADASTTRQYGGSGLGLAISKSLTQSMHSTLNVYSEYGKGSEFYFTLELPIVYKKDSQMKNDFSNTNIVLLGCEEDCPARELYEEYIRDVKAHVKYTTNIDDIRSDDIKIIGMSYDNNDYDYIKKVVNDFPDKFFIIFSTSSLDNKIYDIGGTNVYPLVPPLSMSKLISILSDILGYNKSQYKKNKKQKNLSFAGNILLVDDNEVNSRLSEILLKNMGLNVDLAENGQSAVDKYKKNKYDLIFMDIYMPVKDGLTATKEIVAYEKENNIHHVPIVALTANVIEDDIEEYISIGMDDFVAKPIVKNKLEAVLNRYLGKEQTSLNDDLAKGVAEYIKSDDYELITAAVNEYCQVSWHYAQTLFHSVTEFNEGSSLYIIDKMIVLSEKYQFASALNVLNKIKQNIEDGMNEHIFALIDELKDVIYKIKHSIRLYK
ncbi:MAG: ATP-binding protein [Mucispirillum sp.]|nr:ATP-binding protein [Mucispirillum sp.]